MSNQHGGASPQVFALWDTVFEVEWYREGKTVETWANYLGRSADGTLHLEFHYRTYAEPSGFGVLSPARSPGQLRITPLDAEGGRDYAVTWRVGPNADDVATVRYRVGSKNELIELSPEDGDDVSARRKRRVGFRQHDEDKG